MTVLLRYYKKGLHCVWAPALLNYIRRQMYDVYFGEARQGNIFDVVAQHVLSHTAAVG